MKKLFIYLSLIIFASACKKKDDDSTPVTPVTVTYAGYLYTTTNSSAGNAVIMLGRKADGSVQEIEGSPLSTGGNGDAAEGDFDTQSAIRIIGDYLLVVNAGANPVNGSISVFKIDRNNGSLQRIDQDPATSPIDNMDSRGVRCASLGTAITGGQRWVVAGNQFANPHYETAAATPVGVIMNTPLRNLVSFKFDETSGLLTFNNIAATYDDGTNGGPANVEFNAAGTKIAVSTWGVTHIMTPDVDLSLQKPGRLYVYDFLDGSVSQTGMFEEAGISGSIGLVWSPDDHYIYLSNFNLHSSKEMNSVTVHDGVTAAKIQNFETGSRNDEACWTCVSKDRTKLFVASFVQGVVSVFDIGSNNMLSKSLSPNYFQRSGVPMDDTKDMYQSNDNYLYVSGSFMSHSVSIFKIAGDGSLSEMSGSPYHVPSSANNSSMVNAFLGLTGFDK